MPVSIGERFDAHGWNRLDGIGKIASDETPKRYTIDSVKHTIIEKCSIIVELTNGRVIV